MLGLMQDWPLLLHKILDHAAIQHADQMVVTRSIEGPMHRETFVDLRRRSLQVAKRLEADGIETGDRIATLAWNSWRHMEIWYGVTGIGAIAHTVNPRLFADQIAWIINHAEDRVMMVDLTFVPLLESLAPRLPSIERYVVLTDAEHMPRTSLRHAVAFEDWLREADADFEWPAFDENTAAGLCYTSGTTGMPKGVLYSHRSNVLHAMQACWPEMLNLSANEIVLPVVPMFHANAWSLAYSLPMVGARIVMPGAKLDGASLFDLMDGEGVTMSAGVPTIWKMLLDTMRQRGRAPLALRRVGIGGSACPRAMIAAFECEFGVEVGHAWGMTETSPIGTGGFLVRGGGALDREAVFDRKAKQGAPPFGVELVIADDQDRTLAWDGSTFGRVKVRGPCVARSYFRDEAPVLDAEGYFDTGDIASVDPDGTLCITDRSKDVIKSGGEWISSVQIETIAVAHPDVAEAAVIGMRHPKWGERPLLVVVPVDGRQPGRDELLSFLSGKIAKWWMPDDVQLVSEIPHTAAGKIDKLGLRERFEHYTLPTA